MRTYSLLLTLTLLPSAARADQPPTSFNDTIRAAVAARKVEDSDNLSRTSFRDVAEDGSVLVGVEVGLAKWFDREIPYAVRPIFRRGDREWTGGTAGDFSSRHIVRRERETARPGYAVSGLWVRTGAGIDRVRLVYAKVTPRGLDPADSYSSRWIGTSDGGSDQLIDGEGRPIVGLAANAGRDQARSLGLVFAQVPPVPKKEEPRKKEEAPPEPKATGAEPKATGAEPKAAIPPPPAEDVGSTKSRLEEEATPREEVEDPTLILLLLLVCLMIGVPMGVFALASMGKPARRRRVDLDDDEDDQPRRRRRDPEDDERPRQRHREPDEADDRPRRPRPPVDERPRRESPERPIPVAPAPAASARPELPRRLAGYVPVPPAAVPAAAAPVEEHGEAPPYFLVRATYRSRHERMTRIYVRPTELLVIDAGPGTDVNMAAGIAAAALTGGGLIGAFVGGAVGGMVADAGKAKGEAIQQRLNGLDLPGLLDLARASGNVRAPLSELVGVSIEPPSSSMWRERTRAVGMFRFRHLKGGEYTFEFLNGAELRGAVELLRRVLGPALRVGQGWDAATEVYLQGVTSQ